MAAFAGDSAWTMSQLPPLSCDRLRVPPAGTEVLAGRDSATEGLKETDKTHAEIRPTAQRVPGIATPRFNPAAPRSARSPCSGWTTGGDGCSRPRRLVSRVLVNLIQSVVGFRSQRLVVSRPPPVRLGY